MMEITKEKIREYAQKYDKRYRGKNDEIVEKEMKKWLESSRFLDRERFIKIGLWKSSRPKKHYEANEERRVQEITRFSFATKDERRRVESLLGGEGGLKGVAYPLASVILHFAFPDKYPILDFRAIGSLGIKQPKSYNFNFWQKYCDRIRDIAKEMGESIRTVDKALWEYSKEPHSKKK